MKARLEESTFNVSLILGAIASPSTAYQPRRLNLTVDVSRSETYATRRPTA